MARQYAMLITVIGVVLGISATSSALGQINKPTDSTGYTIVPSSKQNELLFNTSHTEYSTHTDTIQTLYTNTQQQPSISTSTDGKNSIITQVDSYTNVQPSSSFSATPTFSANQEKSYTDLEVRSLTSPNSSNVQESSMMEQFTFEPFYTGSQVNHLEVLSQPLSQVSPEVDGGGCPSPGLTLNGTRVIPRSGMSPDFSTLSEVKFPASLPSPSGKGSASVASSSSVDAEVPSRICKIKCVSGQWVGPLCQEVNGDGRFQPILKSCALEEVPPNLILSFKNRIIIEFNTTIPHNSSISARCQEPIGTYKLSGPSILNCSNGIWSSPIPKCQPTTLFTNYSENSPPTILVRVPSGSAAVDQNGGLVVFPGSILHLECLYLRRHGDPEWTWTSEAETYLTGWAIGNDERNWKYRLSIYYVKQFDTGSFTCTSSRGINNTITLQVSDIHCKPVPSMDLNPHLNYRASGHRLGQTTYFNCPPGFFLKGSANITCLPSGDWSNSPPDCIMVKCPPISVDDSRLIMVEYNDTYGKRAAFKCAWGFQMSGVNSIECLADSTWSHRIPTCTEILCPSPVVPLNGLLIEDSAPGRHVVGSVVQFSCGEKHQLIGKPSMVCTENGTWSHSTPYCKARCEYPGEPLNGRIIPLKFWYVPGDKLKITCLAGYVLPLPLEASPPVCLGDGTWSHTLPECIQYTNV